MNKVLIVPKAAVTADSADQIFFNHAVEVIDDCITKISPVSEYDLKNFEGEIYADEHSVLTPGFVQTHVHLCQTMLRGLADDLELLDWLQLKIFPYENSHDKKSLALSARLGIYELINGGTTTALDMGTLRHQEIIFEELISSGIRAVAGKCMMDINNLFPAFKNGADAELKETEKLASEFHDCANGRIKYGFAPRFALSCSEELLTQTFELTKDFPGSVFHTHASENKSEISEVKKMTGKDNIEYFDSLGLLDAKTVLAHCIHLNDAEINLMKKNSVNVSHCPSSNLKLGSGIANIPRYIKEGINVSLGADGAPCNNNLSAFNEMRLAALIQKPIHGPTAMDAKTIFRMATIDGAKALQLENEIGSIEVGKKADLILINLEKSHQSLSLDNLYSSIVYSSIASDVSAVMIDGKWRKKNARMSDDFLPEEKLYRDARTELNNLLKRVK